MGRAPRTSPGSPAATTWWCSTGLRRRSCRPGTSCSSTRWRRACRSPTRAGWRSRASSAADASALMRGMDLTAVRIDEARRVVVRERVPGLQRLFWSPETDLALALLDDGLKVVYLGFDLAGSNFPRQAAFPLFISQGMEWLRPRGDDRLSSHIAAGATHSIGVPAAQTQVIVRAPSGDAVTSEVKDGTAAFDATAAAGIYRYTVGDVARYFAVSLTDARESDVNSRWASGRATRTGPADGQRRADPRAALALLLYSRWCCWCWSGACGAGAAAMPEFVQPAWLRSSRCRCCSPSCRVRRAGRARASGRSPPARCGRWRSPRWWSRSRARSPARSARHTDVVFALDLSSSISRESVAEALDFVNRAQGIPGTHRAGGVRRRCGGGIPGARGSEPVREVTAQVDRTGTDIGRAIEVAVGAFQDGAQRRVVLLTDGRENLGDARAAAAVARSLGVEIHADGARQARAAQRRNLRAGRDGAAAGAPARALQRARGGPRERSGPRAPRHHAQRRAAARIRGRARAGRQRLLVRGTGGQAGPARIRGHRQQRRGHRAGEQPLPGVRAGDGRAEGAACDGRARKPAVT